MTDDLHRCSAHHLVSSHLIREDRQTQRGFSSKRGDRQTNIHLEDRSIYLEARDWSIARDLMASIQRHYRGNGYQRMNRSWHVAPARTKRVPRPRRGKVSRVIVQDTMDNPFPHQLKFKRRQ
ncbi:hypothetical protein AVEN_143472-1 [Araneus ventricosus]|uniref:Uncharacterized protein n=1 Tax=Araneus ventricosus TaxID=182803 RepID=A0A4Y2JKR2_ARAVE|nr:hypothetical protein AVEN_143472-1 [Araneus ventricosus]